MLPEIEVSEDVDSYSEPEDEQVDEPDSEGAESVQLTKYGKKESVKKKSTGSKKKSELTHSQQAKKRVSMGVKST